MATTQSLQRIDRVVSNLGLCRRRDANAFIRRSVTVDGVRPPSQKLRVDPSRIAINGKPMAELVPLLVGVALHKPAGYVSSRARDAVGALVVYDLLPAEWGKRRPGLEVAGRLDKEATGLLVLSQDGQFISQAIARGHEREYEVTTERDIEPSAVGVFASGTMQLRQEPTPLLPAELVLLEPKRARVTVREGRYHQVRRMFEAVGNRLVSIKRVRMAGVSLGDLKPGEYRLLSPAETDSLRRPKAADKQRSCEAMLKKKQPPAPPPVPKRTYETEQQRKERYLAFSEDDIGLLIEAAAQPLPKSPMMSPRSPAALSSSRSMPATAAKSAEMATRPALPRPPPARTSDRPDTPKSPRSSQRPAPPPPPVPPLAERGRGKSKSGEGRRGRLSDMLLDLEMEFDKLPDL